MTRHYSHIVIGAGALGSAAAYRLARAGATDVLVLDSTPWATAEVDRTTTLASSATPTTPAPTPL